MVKNFLTRKRKALDFDVLLCVPLAGERTLPLARL